MPDKPTGTTIQALRLAGSRDQPITSAQTSREGQGSPRISWVCEGPSWRLERTDLFHFTVLDFGVSRTPSKGHVSLFMYLSVPEGCCKRGLLPFVRAKKLSFFLT